MRHVPVSGSKFLSSVIDLKILDSFIMGKMYTPKKNTAINGDDDNFSHDHDDSGMDHVHDDGNDVNGDHVNAMMIMMMMMMTMLMMMMMMMMMTLKMAQAVLARAAYRFLLFSSCPSHPLCSKLEWFWRRGTDVGSSQWRPRFNRATTISHR